MQQKLIRTTKLTAAALFAFGSLWAMTGEASAQPPRRSIDGHIIVCGRGNIPVQVYAAEHYYARPSVCGGSLVNDNLNPDFQLTKGGR
jgi:hypothetical protein